MQLAYGNDEVRGRRWRLKEKVMVDLKAVCCYSHEEVKRVLLLASSSFLFFCYLLCEKKE